MLTKAQRKAYDFIKRFMAEHPYAPTAAEIANGIGIRSRGVVHRYLKAIAQAGYIELEPKRHRNIRLANQLSGNQLPLVGMIAAGSPIEVMEEYEAIDVANIFLGDNRFALRVKGNSMIEEGIFDGDIVVCEKTEIADDGQIVVALIDRHEATLKRIKRENGCVLLIPANSQLSAMSFSSDRVQVQGIYVGLLRFAG